MDKEKQNGNKPHASRRTITKRQFLVNLCLLLGLVVSVAVWFHRHIQSYAVESMLVGGTLTVWGLFELIRATLEWAAEDEMKALPQRVLGSRASMEYLLLGLVLSGLLHLCTSSLSIEYQPTEDAKFSYKVEVLYRTNGLPFLEPLQVTSDKRVQGRPYLFHWRTVPLLINLVEPRGYEPIEADFGLGTRAHWQVPSDFKAKEFHLLRLVPSPKLMTQLPEPGKDPETEYELQVVRNGKTNLVGSLRKQVLYLGAAVEDMENVVGREKPEARHRELDGLLARINYPSAQRSKVFEAWEKDPAFAATEEFGRNETIELIVRIRNETGFLIRNVVTNEANHEIRTILLDTN